MYLKWTFVTGYSTLILFTPASTALRGFDSERTDREWSDVDYECSQSCVATG